MFTFGAKPNSKLPITRGELRIEKAAPVKKPKLLPSKIASNSSHESGVSSSNVRVSSKSRQKPFASDKLDPEGARKRKPQRQISPAQQRLSDDSDDEVGAGSSANSFTVEKRPRTSELLDSKRQLDVERPFSEKDATSLIHAAHVANKNEYGISVEMQYPAALQREEFRTYFEAVEGKDNKTLKVLCPVAEFLTVASLVKKIYLSDEQKPPFDSLEPNPGLIRKLERAGNLLEQDGLNKLKQQAFKDAVNAYNDALKALMKIEPGGVLRPKFDQKTLRDLTAFILGQVYERAVSPQVSTLTKLRAKDKKGNEKDNTYGELLHKFVSGIITETRLKSDQVFVDLGSGVGNVVLQAALEVGCESWGCEMMEPAYKLAEAQEKEFAVRCRLWGIRPGTVHLERGDFRENEPIKEAMRRADVILVNNEVFGSDLNQNLIDMFLDVKDGCRIVSLKSFVPHGHKMTERNANNPINLLRNERKEYAVGSVSWKNAPGTYFIATKDSTRLRNFS